MNRSNEDPFSPESIRAAQENLQRLADLQIKVPNPITESGLDLQTVIAMKLFEMVVEEERNTTYVDRNGETHNLFYAGYAWQLASEFIAERKKYLGIL